MAMASTILSIPSKIWTDRGSIVKYSTSTRVARIACTSSPGDKHLGPYFNPDEDDVSTKQTRKLKEFKKLVMKSKGDQFSFKTLECIDAVQRLGIDHHFQQEMEIWRHEHMTNLDFVDQSKHDLYQLSLSFRLIREQGHHVSADIFLRLKNEEGNIEIIKEHRKDARALMALYEASQLSIKGEKILDEAENLSSHLLNQMLTQVDNKTAAIIANTLKYPYHKSLTTLNADNFSLEFEGIKTWEKTLKELSHLEFLVAQEKHRQELHQVSKWWKDVGLVEELTHARDQILLWYTFPMGMLPDLSLSDERIDLTKCIALIYYIDDIFDLYGKPDELALFTQVVNRWDLSAADQLPDYMKKCFHTLYDTTNEIGDKIIRKHGTSNALLYLQKSWGRIFNSFLVEARWFDSHELPKSDEYLKNGSISIGVELLLVHAFFLLGLGHVSTDLERVSGIIASASTIFRVWDDMGGAKDDEDESGYDGSYIACYMKEHKGISVEVAREHAEQVIADEWKRLNEECLGLSQYFSTFKRASLNIARMGPVMYDSDNKQRLPALDNYINSMVHTHHLQPLLAYQQANQKPNTINIHV